MSRCYPYPPPKNQRNGGGAHEEPWCVEPLKIQNERKRVQTEPRKGKRERKDRSKVRKRDDGNLSSVWNKCHKSEKSLYATRKEEEQERSDLTEEHEDPVRSHGYCYVVGSTHETSNSVRSHGYCYVVGSTHETSNSDKDESASTDSGRRRNIIRIRLPSQKPKDSDESPLCSTSGREDAVTQQKDESPIHLDRQASVSSLGHNISMPILVSVSCLEKASSSNDSKNKGSVILKEAVPTVESLYKSLIEDWVPPILHPEQDVLDDEDWLFGSRAQPQKIKRLEPEQDVSCTGSSDLWPRAKYLPVADVYALPFTVPF